MIENRISIENKAFNFLECVMIWNRKPNWKIYFFLSSCVPFVRTVYLHSFIAINKFKITKKKNTKNRVWTLSMMTQTYHRNWKYTEKCKQCRYHFWFMKKPASDNIKYFGRDRKSIEYRMHDRHRNASNFQFYLC